MHLGYLSSKNLNNLAEFKLYRSKIEYSVSITRGHKQIKLSQSEYDLLVRINESLFNDLLQLQVQFDFENSQYGEFILFLEKSRDTIDWTYMKSLHLNKHTFLEFYINKTPAEKASINYENLILKLNNSFVKSTTYEKLNQHLSVVFSVKCVENNMNPLTEYPVENSNVANFKEHFKVNYGLET